MRLRGIAVLLVSVLTHPAMAKTPLQTVPHVDVDRYMGKWYEVARLPNRFERKCDRDIMAEYARQGKTVSVRNTCIQSNGKPKIAQGRARIVDTASNARLKVTFFWPFYGDYWIIGLDSDYGWAIVGEPSRRYLWVLSRTPSLPAETLQGIRQQVETAGYSPSALVYPRQTGSR